MGLNAPCARNGIPDMRDMVEGDIRFLFVLGWVPMRLPTAGCARWLRRRFGLGRYPRQIPSRRCSIATRSKRSSPGPVDGPGGAVADIEELTRLQEADPGLRGRYRRDGSIARLFVVQPILAVGDLVVVCLVHAARYHPLRPGKAHGRNLTE